MERVFCSNLRRILCQYVKGSVSVHIVDNTLIVDIEAEKMLPFRYTIRNINSRILYGMTSTQLALEIVKQYKTCILNHYFARKF